VGGRRDSPPTAHRAPPAGSQLLRGGVAGVEVRAPPFRHSAIPRITSTVRLATGAQLTTSAHPVDASLVPDADLRTAANALGIDDLAVREPVRPAPASGVFALACGWLTRVRGRAGAISIDGDELIVDAPALLREPLTIGKAAVAVASVDTRRREGGETSRFPYAHEYETAETYGWLYLRNNRSPLPILNDVPCLPNLVVVLDRPLDAPACRRRAPKGSPRPPLRGRELRGFFAHVCDPEAARQALRDWGVMRPLTVADAERVAPQR
jgi:hypothetical protein